MNPRDRRSSHTHSQSRPGKPGRFDKSKAIKSLDSAEDVMYAYLSTLDYDDTERHEIKATIRGLQKIKDYFS